MRAMQCRQLGGPEQLSLRTLPDDRPGDGEVVIDVAAAGVNFPDGLIIAGTYQTKHEPPFVPGSEVGGTIAELGRGVRDLEVGTPVSAFCGMGGYADRVMVHADHVYPIPHSMGMDHAAAFPVVYGTSYHGLVDQADLRDGETLLVLGASGGVGLTAVQIGKAIGATVIAAASDDSKLALCAQHGADHLINYATDDLAARIKDIVGTVDVVYDPVGGDHAQAAIRRLAWHGRYLTVGYASGDIPRIGLNRLLLGEASVTGVLWGAWARRYPTDNQRNFARLMEWYEAGLLRPHISDHYPLEQAGEALRTVMDRRVRGKITLRMQEGARP